MSSAFPDHNAHGRFLSLRARSQRLLALAVALSLGLHFTLVVVLPDLASEPPRPKPHVLEVVMVRAEAPPVARTEPPPALERRGLDDPPPPKPEPEQKQRKRDGVATKPRQQDPVRSVVPPVPRESAPSDTTVAEPQASAFSEPKPAPPSPAPPPVAPPAKPALAPPAFSASYLRNPPPRYPTAARRNGEQGTVTLRVLVSREGAPARVTVEQTSGSRHLDAAALEAVKAWRFVPARQGTEPVEAWVLVPIVFRLEDAS